MEMEMQIVHNLRLNTPDGRDVAMRGLELAGLSSGFPIYFQVGLGIRNGKKLPERENTIELVLSPNWDRKKVPMVNEIYEAWRTKSIIPEYWSVVKYQPFLPVVIHDLDLDGVTHEDFEYCVQFNYEGASVWLGVLIFVKESLGILKKVDDGKESDSWALDQQKKNGQAPLIFLNAAVGEYNMITRIKAVEFLPSNSHLTIPRYPLAELHAEFEKIDRQKYAESVETCMRCGHYSYQVKLIKCEKCDVYYCDRICRAADSENHAYVECGKEIVR